MADGPFRFQSGAGNFYPQPQQLNHFNTRIDSPAHPSRSDFAADLPSPTRSPQGRASPRNAFAMNNHHSQFSQNVFMNNGHNGHQRFGMPMNSSKAFQGSSHHGHHNQHHGHRQQQDHAGHGSYSNHHQNSSSSGFSAGTPHFAPGQLRNGTPGHTQNGLGRPPNEQWQQQLTLYQASREATGTHPHARNSNIAKGLSSSDVETTKRDADREERNRAIQRNNEQSEQLWLQMDMGGQGLRALSPALFRYDFLTKLYLNSNNLTFLPPAIGRLKNLEELDLSLNLLVHLPPEMGMLVNLKSLLLFDNQLHDLPPDLGSLFKLEMLGIEGNPLAEDLKTLMIEEGTRSTIAALREQGIDMPPPEHDREWVKVDESTKNAEAERFTVMSYNTLCDKYATQSQYGYTPQAVLSWERRKHVILAELRERDADIICLQEIDGESYNEFFRPMLAENGYRGFFYPKSRSRTMPEKDAKLVDGCVTFWKNNKFVCLDKKGIDINSTATNHPDMKGSADVYNRVMPRDDVATVTFLEQRQTGTRFIVGNIHIYWDPRYSDVKAVQAAVVIDQIAKQAQLYTKQPPCTEKALFRYSDGEVEGEDPKEPLPEPGPSKEYRDRTEIPFIMCGDFNSMPDSAVYELFSTGKLEGDHRDFQGNKYGNFTKEELTHPFTLKSAYGNIGELPFTNYTPTFTGIIDYIWYSTSALQVTSLLGPIDSEYISRVPGFPNSHFPSDHLALVSEFVVKNKKERTVVQADFGPQKNEYRDHRGSAK
ncbi:hypothetical protein FH972_026269 [Carpinus fangiana]|uniref:CCR4-Not complex 3'-5'-exoribonuclease subunit Ccr4 n=1 Tax=Carpinus fangiana TaxID=176857 RepID=A0A5N6L3G6_9ROSI|nr:hypothetical protein FH972_026269 [Carpinus fangiana]